MKEYAVIYERAEDGAWGAYALDLPVFALGKTKQETSERMKEALDAYVDEMERMGEALPEPVHVAEIAQVGELTA